MLDEKFVKKLKSQYPQVHPLLFARSVERAKSKAELFDIVDGISCLRWNTPVRWDDQGRRYLPCSLFASVAELDL